MNQLLHMRANALARQISNQEFADEKLREFQADRAAFNRRCEASRRYEESRQAELCEPVHTPAGFAEVWATFTPIQWIGKTGVAGLLMALIIVGIMLG